LDDPAIGGPNRDRSRVVALSNQKGGVGKTTTAINLAAALAARGQRVLLVDMDPQGNASSGLGCPRQEAAMGVYDVLMDYRDLDSVRVPTSVDGLELIPATRDLAGAALELAEEKNRERRLRRALARVREGYDWVFIDCPPTLNLLTVNALVAADSVLIPLQAEYYAMEGLGELLRTVNAVRKSLNPDLEREGILITMTDPRTNLCRDVEAQARHLFGHEVFEAVIPRNVRLGEAPSHGQAIVHYDPSSTGARAHLALADELIARRAGGTRGQSGRRKEAV
jgi:chromosome partitioning protein